MSARPAHLDAVRSRLAGLGRSLRARLAAAGVARLVGVAGLLLVGFFAADRLLDLPLTVRRFVRLGLLQRPEGMGVVVWLVALGVCSLLALGLARGRRGPAAVFAFLAAGLAGVLAWLAWRVFQPLGVSLGADDLAQAVERRHPELHDRLASALDFERELYQPTRGESPSLMAHVVGEAEAEARSLDLSRTFSARPLRRGLAVGAAGVGALGLAALLWPADMGLFLRRSLALEPVAWPRSTTLLAVDLDADGGVREHDPAVPYEVAVGRPLTIYAQARGSVPDDVLLLDRADGGEPLARRMFRVPERDDLFAFEMRDVRRDFEFVLRGGDDEDDEPVWRVAITVAPRLLDVRTRVEPPAYLGEPAVTLDDGNVRVPEGSKLEITFRTDAPAAEAYALVDENRIEATRVDEVEGAPAGTVFRFPLQADTSTSYRIAFRTAEGRRNDASSATWRVTVVPDRAPRVGWIWPRGVVDTTAKGRVSLIAEAEDDHAVSGLSLDVRVGDAVLASVPLEPYAPRDGDEPPPAINPAALDGPLGRDVVRAYLPLDLPTLLEGMEGLNGDAPRISVRFVARDARDQVREGEWTPIDVFGEAAVERSIAGRRSSVRAAFLGARRDQQARREEVAALLQGPIGAPEKDELRSIRFRQGRIAQDVDRATQDMIAVLTTYVFARLGGAQQPMDRILALIDQHHRATYGRAEGAGEGAWAGDPVFPYVLMERIVAGWRSREIFDNGVLDRMLAVLADAVQLAARVAPAAHRASGVAAEGERASIEALATRQDEVLALLDRLDRALVGWQSLAELTEEVRSAAQEQEAFVRLLEEMEAARRAAGTSGDGGAGDNR